MPLDPAFSLALPLAQIMAWRLWAVWLKKGAGKLLIACLYLAVNALAVSVVFNWYWTTEPPPANPVAWSWFYRPILLWELAHLAWLAICVLIFIASLPVKYWAKRKAKGLPSLFKAKSEAPPLLALRLSILTLLLAGALFGYIRQLAPPQLVRAEVSAPNLPKELGGLTIAFLSDLRYGRGANLSDLASLFESLSLYRPDVLIMYGRTIEKSPELASDLAPLIAQLAPSKGAYAVLPAWGFSENDLIEAFKSSGIETLSGSRLSLPDLPLTLVGFGGAPSSGQGAAPPSKEAPEGQESPSESPSE
ncbi:MAG: hypothetical protein LBE49_05805, partial [Deltaproteobacteria bacterium]|nr:hypothetical protein [Deltaproteobacteria bacterium]